MYLLLLFSVSLHLFFLMIFCPLCCLIRSCWDHCHNFCWYISFNKSQRGAKIRQMPLCVFSPSLLQPNPNFVTTNWTQSSKDMTQKISSCQAYGSKLPNKNQTMSDSKSKVYVNKREQRGELALPCFKRMLSPPLPAHFPHLHHYSALRDPNFSGNQYRGSYKRHVSKQHVK